MAWSESNWSLVEIIAFQKAEAKINLRETIWNQPYTTLLLFQIWMLDQYSFVMLLIKLIKCDSILRCSTEIDRMHIKSYPTTKESEKTVLQVRVLEHCGFLLVD